MHICVCMYLYIPLDFPILYMVPTQLYEKSFQISPIE